jgi:predicted Zn-dependent protease
VLLVADEWDVVMEVFDVYRSLLVESHLTAWACTHFSEAYQADPNNYRLGRLALMLQITEGQQREAAHTLTALRGLAPSHLHPDEWVLATLSRWPSPEALPLLRRLSDDDPLGSWRYEIIGAQLMIQAGRLDDARSSLERVRQQQAGTPSILAEVGETYFSMTGSAERQTGCFLVGAALAAQPRDDQFRLSYVECLRELNKANDAYRMALEGFAHVRDLAVADLLFDQLVSTMPYGVTPEQLAARLREEIHGRDATLQEWLEQRLTTWLTPAYDPYTDPYYYAP